MLEREPFMKSEIFVNGFFLDNSRFFHTFAPTFNLLAYEKTSFIILMCVMALSVGAMQKEKLILTPVAACSNPDGFNHRHKTLSKKPLQVYYDDVFVYLQNAFVGGRVTFLDEFGNVLHEEMVSASECVIEKPQSVVAIQISYGDVVLIGYLD